MKALAENNQIIRRITAIAIATIIAIVMSSCESKKEPEKPQKEARSWTNPSVVIKDSIGVNQEVTKVGDRYRLHTYVRVTLNHQYCHHQGVSIITIYSTTFPYCDQVELPFDSIQIEIPKRYKAAIDWYKKALAEKVVADKEKAVLDSLINLPNKNKK